MDSAILCCISRICIRVWMSPASNRPISSVTCDGGWQSAQTSQPAGHAAQADSRLSALFRSSAPLQRGCLFDTTIPLARPLLLHQPKQSCIEINGRILSEAFQFFIHRGDLDQSRHVAPWSHRNGHVRHFESENFIKFPVKPDSVNLFHVPPLLYSDNEVEAFFHSNAADAENLRHINDTNPTHLHVIARHFGRCGHEFTSLQHRDARHVVSHKTVSALNQPQHTFAFSDAAYAADQHADT